MSYDELVVNKKLNLNELQGLDRLQLELILAYLLPAFETYTSKSIRAMEFYVLILQLIEKEIFINLSIELNLMLVREANQLLEQLNLEHQKFINQCNEIFKSDHLSNLEKQRLIEEIIKLLQERIDFNNRLIAMLEVYIGKLEKISKELGVYIEKKYDEIETNLNKLLLTVCTGKTHTFYLSDNQSIKISEDAILIKLANQWMEKIRNHDQTEIKQIDINYIVEDEILKEAAQNNLQLVSPVRDVVNSEKNKVAISEIRERAADFVERAHEENNSKINEIREKKNEQNEVEKIKHEKIEEMQELITINNKLNEAQEVISKEILHLNNKQVVNINNINHSLDKSNSVEFKFQSGFESDLEDMFQDKEDIISLNSLTNSANENNDSTSVIFQKLGCSDKKDENKIEPAEEQAFPNLINHSDHRFFSKGESIDEDTQQEPELKNEHNNTKLKK